MSDKGILLRTLNEAPGTGPLPDDYQAYVETPAGKSYRTPVGRLPGAGSTPGGGGAANTKAISFEVTQDGEQTFQLPATATGVALVQKQTPNPQPNGAAPIDGETSDVNAEHYSYDTATQVLTVLAEAGLQTGQILTVTYLYGGAGGGAGGSVDFSDLTGTADVSQLPVADAAYIQQLFDALKPLLDQRYTQI